MRRRFAGAALIGILLGGGAAVVVAQPGPAPAIVVAVLRAIGLFGDGYSDGNIPTWSAASRKFLPGAGGSAAPVDATYVTQSANATLTNEVNLAADLAHLDFGLLPSTTGAGLRLSNDSGVYARNQANNADRRLIAISPTNVIQVGSNAQNLDLGEAWVIDSGSGNLCTNSAACTGQSFYMASKQLRIGTPTVGNVGANSCGTTAATIAGTDTSGKVVVGATAGSQCRVTFSAAWTNAPACVVTNETTGNLVRAASTTTRVDLTGTFVAGDSLAYACIGY